MGTPAGQIDPARASTAESGDTANRAASLRFLAGTALVKNRIVCVTGRGGGGNYLAVVGYAGSADVLQPNGDLWIVDHAAAAANDEVRCVREKVYDDATLTASSYPALLYLTTSGQVSTTPGTQLRPVGALTAEGKVWLAPSQFRAHTVSSFSRQGAPSAKTTAAVLTAAEILTRIITVTHAAGADQAYQLPTGTLMSAMASLVDGDAIEWSLINLSAAAADTATITANTDHTIVGVPTVQSAHASTGTLYGNAVRFLSRKSSGNTWITYRIGG